MCSGLYYFEDYEVGAVYEYGYASVSEEEIVAFAQRFDPQAMHVDAEYAARGPFGGLIASGWHTAGIFMRLHADHYLSQDDRLVLSLVAMNLLRAREAG
jgi:acyl dehydratase